MTLNEKPATRNGENDSLGALIDFLQEQIPDAIMRRTLHEKCTVRPASGFTLEPSALAAERDVKELFGSELVQMQVELSLRQDPKLTRQEIDLMSVTVLHLTAMMCRGQIEMHRDAYIHKSKSRMVTVCAMLLLCAILAFLYYTFSK